MNERSPEQWLGQVVEQEERITPLLVERIAATFGEACPAPGDPLPALWHWGFFQPAEPASALGRDGHPARGGFLPPAEGRIRMWAGARLVFHRPLVVDALAARRSEIIAVKEKQGRSGALLFVTLRHVYAQNDETAFTEEQDIVYRQPSAPRLSIDEPRPESDWAQTITPSPTLLFRYSAVTFNGHRIHYDWPYATEQEGYPGLVVHGPLIATALLRAFEHAHPTARVETFDFQSLRPLIAPTPFEVAGRVSAPGRATLWAGNADGPAQRGEIVFQPA